MATNGLDKNKMPTTDMIAAQALELADNIRALADQSVEEAARLKAFADSAANNIVEAVGRFSNQTNTLLAFIDRSGEACQIAIDSISITTSALKDKLPPQQESRR